MSVTESFEIAYEGDDLDLRHMVEAAHQVAELMRHPGWQHYQDFLYSEIATMQGRIQSGSLETLEQYKFWTGRIQGIQQALTTGERLTALVEANVEARQGEPSEASD